MVETRRVGIFSTRKSEFFRLFRKIKLNDAATSRKDFKFWVFFEIFLNSSEASVKKGSDVRFQSSETEKPVAEARFRLPRLENRVSGSRFQGKSRNCSPFPEAEGFDSHLPPETQPPPPSLLLLKPGPGT